MTGRPKTGLRRWLELALGLACLLALIRILAAGPLPPGYAGEVIGHNLDRGIQTTALFYMDLDRMPELEANLDGQGPAERLRPTDPPAGAPRTP
jgi:hypothetical protein